jgi:DNA-binding NarL/FixJ family response regulator
MINLILADDHKIIRDGIKALLSGEPRLNVVGEASNGAEVLDLLAARPEADVVLLDLNMPVMDGFEAMEHIRERFPKVKVVALSMLDHENYVYQVMEAGAMGYILKNTGTEELIFGIERAAQGIRFICSEISLNLLRRNKDLQQQQQPVPMGFADSSERSAGDLSKREAEVLSLIAQGFTNAEIAEKLFTSRRTIESHRQNLLDKTGAKNTATLIVYGISKGLIRTSTPVPDEPA